VAVTLFRGRRRGFQGDGRDREVEGRRGVVIRISVIQRGFGPIFHGDQTNSKITTRELNLRQIKSNPLELLTLKLTGINSHAWYNIRSQRSASKHTDMRPQTLGLFWSLSELENNKFERYKAAAITLYG
jgi:hypothetical protein